MKSQITEIHKYMQEHPEGITSIQAINMFGATRLSGVIYALKRKLDNGEYIETVRENVKTRYGNTASIARYKLKERGR